MFKQQRFAQCMSVFLSTYQFTKLKGDKISFVHPLDGIIYTCTLHNKILTVVECSAEGKFQVGQQFDINLWLIKDISTLNSEYARVDKI